MKRMDFSAKKSSDLQRIGNVIVENTNELDTRELFAINAELK
ncbi:MAG: hypothetical protein ACD_8C00031G0001 [uncultured bacterium]|nr:MAG: hypothetical protein ACD_8C00031G0001 [uncultured bacterium]